MSLVRSTDKKSGITYVYESKSYWDKEKKQPRNKRKLIGKIDPQTGEIVPTRNHAPKSENGDSNLSKMSQKQLISLCHSYEKEIARQAKVVQSQEEEIQHMKSTVKALAGQLQELIKGLDAI